MIICHPCHPSQLCQDPDSISRTVPEQFVLVHIIQAEMSTVVCYSSFIIKKINFMKMSPLHFNSIIFNAQADHPWLWFIGESSFQLNLQWFAFADLENLEFTLRCPTSMTGSRKLLLTTTSRKNKSVYHFLANLFLERSVWLSNQTMWT